MRIIWEVAPAARIALTAAWTESAQRAVPCGRSCGSFLGNKGVMKCWQKYVKKNLHDAKLMRGGQVNEHRVRDGDMMYAR